ncbi:MAG: DUF6596 domain-containing protein [Myxococcota bacterium]
MAQRVSRAKQSIKASAIPFALPREDERQARLGAVLHVLYLIFNEGYAASVGRASSAPTSPTRPSASRARCAPPQDAGCGLLALMLLTDAHKAARSGPAGELVPLDEQDRTLGPGARREGVALVSDALGGGAGVGQLSAAGRHRRAARRGARRRRHRLAARSGALREPLQAHERQPHGGAQQGHRRGHGARAAARPDARRGARRGPAPRRPLPPRRRARPPAGEGRRPRRGRRRLPRRRAAHGQRARARLSHGARRRPTRPGRGG